MGEVAGGRGTFLGCRRPPCGEPEGKTRNSSRRRGRTRRRLKRGRVTRRTRKRRPKASTGTGMGMGKTKGMGQRALGVLRGLTGFSGGVQVKVVFERNYFSHDNTENDQSDSTSGVPLGRQKACFPRM